LQHVYNTQGMKRKYRNACRTTQRAKNVETVAHFKQHTAQNVKIVTYAKHLTWYKIRQTLRTQNNTVQST